MNFIELTKKNANFIDTPNQAIIDAMQAVRRVYAIFPEPVQKKYHNLYDSILTGLGEVRNDYVALGSYLLSDATLQMFTATKEEEK